MSQTYETNALALLDRQIGPVDLDVFRLARLIDDALDEGPERVAALLADLLDGGWDPSVAQYATNLAIRDRGRWDQLDCVEFFEALRPLLCAALDERLPAA